MPFTVSHAAAVLPLHRFSKHKLPLTALMVGSMAPDFGYFFSHEASRALTHSFAGLFIFALPAGLLVWLFYVAILEKATITLLSDRWHTRFAHTDAITPSLIARASIAIVLGAVTHVLWDAFTHRGTFVTDAFPALLGPTPGFELAADLPFAAWPELGRGPGDTRDAGRGICTACPRSRSSGLTRSASERASARSGFLVIGSLLAALIDWLPYAHARYDAQLFFAAVGRMSGFFVAWCCIAVGMWIHARRGAK